MISALEIMLESAYDEGCKNGKKKAEAELTRTKRALWLARAERAKELQWLNGSKWVIVEHKCRAYADKFMEE